jgi:hypothetical protein
MEQTLIKLRVIWTGPDEMYSSPKLVRIRGPHPHGKQQRCGHLKPVSGLRGGGTVPACRCALVHHAMGMTTTTTTRPRICTAPRIYIRPLKTVRLTTTAMVPRPKAHDDATLWDGSSDRCSSIQKNMACRPAQPPEVRCAFVAFPFPWQPPPRRISRPSVTYAGRGK